MRKLKNEELGRVDIENFRKLGKNPLVIVLDNVRSMHNVGSAFRTADAFLIEKLILCGITARPPHREIHKTALGATESVEWVYEETTLGALKKLKGDGYTIISVEQADKSVSLHTYKPAKNSKYAIVFGNEVFGVDEEIVKASDTVIEVPQFGTKHSLNISVCIGVVMWDFLAKMELIH